MTFSDEHLSAYLDGELDLAKENALTDALAEDQELRQRLEELRLANDLVKKTYAPIGDEPLPSSVFEAIDDHFADDGKVVRPQARRKKSWLTQWQTPLAAAFAMAAGLTLGGNLVQTADTSEAPVSLMAGLVSTDSPLHTVLATTPSAQIAVFGETSVKPVLTFMTVDGELCREVLISNEDRNSRALGCRSGETWTILATVVEPGLSGDGQLFSTAASPASQIFDRTVGSLIVGAPLSAEQEADALGIPVGE